MMDQRSDHLLQEAEGLLHAREAGLALTLLTKAETAGADSDRCSAGRWMAYMLLANYDAAWRESDAILKRGAPDPHRFWMGEAIEGRRVIVRCLHGFGDSVQMLRYAPMLRERAAKLMVEVHPRFAALARCFDGVDEVIVWREQALAFPPAWDVQIEVTELPYFFRTTAEQLPIAHRYLHLPDANAPVLPTTATVKLRVGLVWASGSWNAARSVALELLHPLLRTTDCQFWNLQGGSALVQAASLRDLPNFHTHPDCADSILRLAQTIAQMDLVITPDTLAAHLAGALGVSAWVMLQHAADWRWMLHREDTPWYPSLRLFRQPTEGDWKSVLGRVQSELSLLVAHPSKEQVLS